MVFSLFDLQNIEELICRSSGQLGQRISQINLGFDSELLVGGGEAINEMLLLIFHSLGNKNGCMCRSLSNPL